MNSANNNNPSEEKAVSNDTKKTEQTIQLELGFKATTTLSKQVKTKLHNAIIEHFQTVYNKNNKLFLEKHKIKPNFGLSDKALYISINFLCAANEKESLTKEIPKKIALGKLERCLKEVLTGKNSITPSMPKPTKNKDTKKKKWGSIKKLFEIPIFYSTPKKKKEFYIKNKFSKPSKLYVNQFKYGNGFVNIRSQYELKHKKVSNFLGKDSIDDFAKIAALYRPETKKQAKHKKLLDKAAETFIMVKMLPMLAEEIGMDCISNYKDHNAAKLMPNSAIKPQTPLSEKNNNNNNVNTKETKLLEKVDPLNDDPILQKPNEETDKEMSNFEFTQKYCFQF